MSLEQLESAILELTPQERQRLAVWFEENRREWLGDDDSDELAEEQQAEIIRRRDFALTHPELLEPWDGTSSACVSDFRLSPRDWLKR